MNATTDETANVSTDSCHFCGETEVLQEHHIVPRRFDGSDESVNLVDLCPTCHRKIEAMYDKRFYDELGVEKPEGQGSDTTHKCGQTECTATADHELTCPQDGAKSHYCDAHKECANTRCEKRRVTTVPINGTHIPFCDEHRTCEASGCENQETRVYKSDAAGDVGEFRDHKVFCEYHALVESPWIGDEWMGEWNDE